MPCIQINNSKASALISIYAAQVLSFKPINEATDLMFVSENAFFQEGKAIKGGTPICWPWFGTAPGMESQKDIKRPAHGFVRNSFWSVSSAEVLANGDTKVVLEIKDSEQSRAIWPFRFYLALEIVIGESLSLELLTRNTGNQPFTITEALHTYINVGDATQATVFGLEHTEYLNKKEDFIPMCQVGALTIAEETDHIHTDIKHQLIIEDPVFKRKIKITSSGNKNVVVWNPWAEIAAEMADLKNDDYKYFICLEVANVATDGVEILPGSEYRMDANYSVV
ncbi:MAG: glucose-6-phosphate 1-epimerase [Methyloprofundus sp.]|nr:MAG: glucose-6-phosphate 1-epimerase [Methyloprofundus sp.]